MSLKKYAYIGYSDDPAVYDEGDFYDEEGPQRILVFFPRINSLDKILESSGIKM